VIRFDVGSFDNGREFVRSMWSIGLPCKEMEGRKMTDNKKPDLDKNTNSTVPDFNQIGPRDIAAAAHAIKTPRKKAGTNPAPHKPKK
jgi:hypothetical protein